MNFAAKARHYIHGVLYCIVTSPKGPGLYLDYLRLQGRAASRTGKEKLCWASFDIHLNKQLACNNNV